MDAAPRDPHEALTALERLYAKKVVTLQEAQAAAKLIMGDANAVFPPRVPPKPAPTVAPPPPDETTASGEPAHPPAGAEE